MIRKWICSQTNKAVLIDGENTIAHSDLCEMISAVSNGVSRLKTDKVAIYLPDDSSFVATFFGVIAAGRIVFPLSIQLTGYEVLPLLKWSGTGAVITSKQHGSLFEMSGRDASPGLHILCIEDLCRSDFSCPPDITPIDPDAPLVLLCTSGTTGNAKIVQLSLNNIETSTIGYLDKINAGAYKEAVKIILATPLSTSYGIMILTATMLSGFTLVLLPNNFTLTTMFKAIERHGITHYEGGILALQLMERMAGRPNPYDIRSLTYIGFGGSKLSGDEIKRLENAYPHMRFCQGYGMSEASPLISKHHILNLKKTDSCGTAIKGVEIAVEADGIITREPYAQGELVIRGANVMLGYYNNRIETDRVIRNGYLYSGDIGYLDDEGYVYICGRKKNVIIVRGFNVHPEEVENCILGSRLADDCIVYGETDASGHEIVCADIVPSHSQATVDELYTYCNAHLVSYKRPQRIRLHNSVKKTASGKTERNEGLQ